METLCTLVWSPCTDLATGLKFSRSLIISSRKATSLPFFKFPDALSVELLRLILERRLQIPKSILVLRKIISTKGILYV